MILQTKMILAYESNINTCIKVNNSSSLSSSSTATSTSKSIQNKSKDAINDDLIAINEKLLMHYIHPERFLLQL